MSDQVTDSNRSSLLLPEVQLNKASSSDFFGSCVYVLDHKWRIVAFAILCAALGAAYAFLAAPWYRSEVIVMPADNKSQLPAGLGQISGLASLAGINVGSSGAEESLATLRSHSLAAEFIKSHDLIFVFFSDEWDAERKAWKDERLEKQPDIRKAVEYFNEKVLTIGEDKRSGTVTIGIQWKNPQLAASWANDFALLINERLRRKALEESERNVRYLQQEISSSGIVPMQQSISRVLESEMQKLMMAKGSEEYAFKVIDRAVPARDRFRPQRGLLVAMSMMSGSVLAICLLLVRRSWLANYRRQLARQ